MDDGLFGVAGKRPLVSADSLFFVCTANMPVREKVGWRNG